MDKVKRELLPASILVVDDHHENLQWLVEILSSAGYSVRPTTDWEAAIVSAQASPPDLILLDVVLPGTSGYAICKVLKDDERTRDVPVIFVSALSEPIDKVRAFAVGGVDYISKPLHGDEVLARVTTHHLMRRMQRRLQEQNEQLQREIAERQAAEVALQESRALLRAIVDHAPMEITARDQAGRFTMANRKFADLVGLEEPAQALGKRIEDFFSPEQCEAVREVDQLVLTSGQPSVCELPMVYGGQQHVRLVTKFPVADGAGKIVALGTIVQDISERRRTELELEQTNIALRKNVRELSTLNTIARLLSDLGELPEALRQVCIVTTQLLGFRGALIGTFTPGYQSLFFHARFTEEANISSMIGESISLPAGVSQAPARRRTAQERLLGAFHGELSTRLRQKLHLLPMRSHGRLVGVLVVLPGASDRELNLSDLALLQTITGHIATAVENARLYEQAQIHAADAERQRLSRDLHDSVVQLLYSLKLLSEAWSARSAAGTLDDVAGRLRQIGAISQQALREMRLLIHQLRPAVLEEVGLLGALQRRLELVEQRLGIAATMRVEGDFTGLPHILEEQLFAIAQEALNNALRHSGAGEVRVEARHAGGGVTISVCDDGHGFELATQTGGLGLTTMRERAEVIGGTVTISSTLWQGTVVTISAPVQDSGDQELYSARAPLVRERERQVP